MRTVTDTQRHSGTLEDSLPRQMCSFWEIGAAHTCIVITRWLWHQFMSSSENDRSFMMHNINSDTEFVNRDHFHVWLRAQSCTVLDCTLHIDGKHSGIRIPLFVQTDRFDIWILMAGCCYICSIPFGFRQSFGINLGQCLPLTSSEVSHNEFTMCRTWTWERCQGKLGPRLWSEAVLLTLAGCEPHTPWQCSLWCCAFCTETSSVRLLLYYSHTVFTVTAKRKQIKYENKWPCFSLCDSIFAVTTVITISSCPQAVLTTLASDRVKKTMMNALS